MMGSLFKRGGCSIPKGIESGYAVLREEGEEVGGVASQKELKDELVEGAEGGLELRSIPKGIESYPPRTGLPREPGL